MKVELEFKERFIKDFNLPIQIPIPPYFDYFIDLYEEDYGSKTKYQNILKEVGSRFSGSYGKYLDHYYKIRDVIIKDIEDSVGYKDFCINPDFSVIYPNPGEIKSDLYTGAEVGKRFMSIDLKEANFQSLRFYDTFIVKNKETYKEFVKTYDESPNFSESKYTRQVIFGKLNVKRQIQLEKYIIGRIHEEISNILPKDFIVFSKQTDELIFRLPDYYISSGELETKISSIIREKVNVNVKVEIFTTGMLQLFTKNGHSIVGITKTYLTNSKL